MHQFIHGSDAAFADLAQRAQRACVVFHDEALPDGCTPSKARIGFEIDAAGATARLLVDRGVSYTGVDKSIGEWLQRGEKVFPNFQALREWIQHELPRHFSCHTESEDALVHTKAPAHDVLLSKEFIPLTSDLLPFADEFREPDLRWWNRVRVSDKIWLDYTNDGRYHVSSDRADHPGIVTGTGPFLRLVDGFVVEVRAWAPTTGVGGAYGISMGMRNEAYDVSDLCGFFISPQTESFAIAFMGKHGEPEQLPWTNEWLRTTWFNEGNEPNTLKIESFSDRMRVYLNDHLLETVYVDDARITYNLGYIGLSAWCHEETGMFEAYFYDVVIDRPGGFIKIPDKKPPSPEAKDFAHWRLLYQVYVGHMMVVETWRQKRKIGDEEARRMQKVLQNAMMDCLTRGDIPMAEAIEYVRNWPPPRPNRVVEKRAARDLDEEERIIRFFDDLSNT